MNDSRDRKGLIGLLLSAVALTFVVARAILSRPKPAERSHPPVPAQAPIVSSLPTEPIKTAAQTEAPRWKPNRLQVAVMVVGLLFFGLFLWFASPPADPFPPRSESLPFDALYPLRLAMLGWADNATNILIGLGSGALIIVGLMGLLRRRWRAALSAAIVIVCALAALQAQVWLMTDHLGPGTALYLMAGVLFLGWAFFTRRVRRAGINQSDSEKSKGLAPRLELALLLIILIVTIFGRVYDIKRVPYGVDGDESIWTIEVVASKIDNQSALSSDYHYRNVPMSYWMETPFQWLLGPGLTSGRIEVVFFSIVASFVFYLLVRELFDAPTALIATLLLAVALPDLLASRTATVEAHAKLWAVLPLLALAVALRTKRPLHFFLAGAATAGTMLTYEPLLPVVAATAMLAFLAALKDLVSLLRRQGRRGWAAWQAWWPRLGAIAALPIAAAFVTIPYLISRGQYYEGFSSVADSLPLIDRLLFGARGMLSTFYLSPPHDLVFSRDGPYINGLLVPLLFLGVLYALVHIRHKGSAFTLAWLAWVFIPTPVVLHTPLPRVFYPGLPALDILIALAIVAIYRTLARLIQRPLLTASLLMLGLASFALLNLTIWFQEIHSTAEAIQRRQLAETVAANVSPDSLLLMPYDPTTNGDPVLVEQGLMRLLVRERHGVKDAGPFVAIPLNQLLPLIAQKSDQAREIKVLHDTTQDPQRLNRQQIIDALQRCYPNAHINRLDYFTLFDLTSTDLTLPACRSSNLALDPLPAEISSQPITISWALDPAPAATIDLRCLSAKPDTVWIEAESFAKPNGWQADNHFVVDWSGSGYLADQIGSQIAQTTFEAPGDGTYRLWVRSYRRQADNFPGVLQLDDQSFEFARLEAGQNIWSWQALGNVTLSAGQHTLSLSRPFNQSQATYIALFVDTIALSTNPDYDPSRDDRWDEVLQQTRSLPDLARRGAFPITLDPGTYRCDVTASDGDRLISPDGSIGIMATVTFKVMP
jgi:hypothetical protein